MPAYSVPTKIFWTFEQELAEDGNICACIETLVEQLSIFNGPTL